MAKKALVVGINDYSNWNNGVTVGDLSLSAPSLQWCVGDSSSFADLLQSGFNFDQVTTLQDSQATSQAILTGITGLLNSSAAGDTVCFYFSGHGGRLPETAGSSSTRYYETIIPYDTAMISSMQVATIAHAGDGKDDGERLDHLHGRGYECRADGGRPLIGAGAQSGRDQ